MQSCNTKVHGSRSCHGQLYEDEDLNLFFFSVDAVVRPWGCPEAELYGNLAAESKVGSKRFPSGSQQVLLRQPV